MVREKAMLSTSAAHRQHMGQYLTPPETALLAISLFDDDGPAYFDALDLGCGTGMLSSALYARYGERIRRIDAYELDAALVTSYDEAIRPFVEGKTHCGDVLAMKLAGAYDRVIMNPPYGKMGVGDPRRKNFPVSTPNFYSSFMLVGLECLSSGGEMIAIVPRSWTNGSYFDDFRHYVLSRYSLDAMHIYGSRSEVFSDANVLQETMIVRLSKRRQAPSIVVGLSNTKSDIPKCRIYDSHALVTGSNMVVRTEPQTCLGVKGTLRDEGFCPSTGKVVDFRCRENLFEERPTGERVVPVAYAANFRRGALEHPKVGIGKPQWYLADNERLKARALPVGHYVVVKRFTAKEELRRVVAYPLDAKEPIALENHLNFIHAGTPRKTVPLPSACIAKGLAAWLNTSYVEEWFRGVSGSTQVNASDLRAMPCPSIRVLEAIGATWECGESQESTDSKCARALCRGT